MKPNDLPTAVMLRFTTCGGTVNNGHINKALRDPNSQTYYRKDSDDMISAFMLFKDTPDKRGYEVTILCSSTKGMGTALMNQLVARAKKERKEYIKLDSVSSAVGFYRKYGFKGNNKFRMKGENLTMTLKLNNNVK